jgi:hypothetical protein
VVVSSSFFGGKIQGIGVSSSSYLCHAAAYKDPPTHEIQSGRCGAHETNLNRAPNGRKLSISIGIIPKTTDDDDDGGGGDDEPAADSASSFTAAVDDSNICSTFFATRRGKSGNNVTPSPQNTMLEATWERKSRGHSCRHIKMATANESGECKFNNLSLILVSTLETDSSDVGSVRFPSSVPSNKDLYPVGMI